MKTETVPCYTDRMKLKLLKEAPHDKLVEFLIMMTGSAKK